jgi:thioredoxin reductase
MLHEAINIQGLDVPCIVTRVAIVGSGAAALNAAICLRRFGVDDLLIVTEALGAGTSAQSRGSPGG